MDKRDTLLKRLRARLITVPKPGTEPRVLYPGETFTCWTGREHQPGDDAGEQFLPNYSVQGFANQPMRVQPHVYAVEPLCEEAAQEIERLRKALWEYGDIRGGRPADSASEPD